MLKERPFPFPSDKALRVILDTDAACEADDQYCIAHGLMTPRFDIKAVIAEQCGPYVPNGAEQSYKEIKKIVELMGLTDEVNVLRGTEDPLTDKSVPHHSEGSRFIIEEAMRDDPRPLFVCCQGAITNLASALIEKPEIAEKMTLIWIGGAPYPEGGWENNLSNDVVAAQVVFESNIELWQVPMNVYTTMRISFFELLNGVYPYGEIGKYLVENTLQVNSRMNDMVLEIMKNNEGLATSAMLGTNHMSAGAAATMMFGELWSLGDSPVIGLMINNRLGSYHVIDAPCTVNPDSTYNFSKPGSRKIRVYDDIDSHFILNDMMAKFKYYFG